MTNPFKDKPPNELIEMVRGEAVCGECKGSGMCQNPGIIAERIDFINSDCPTCNGTGKQLLSDADLNALTACYCDGKWVIQKLVAQKPMWQYYQNVRDHTGVTAERHIELFPVRNYTTDPCEAMRLQKKYRIDTLFVRGNEAVWSATVWAETKGIIKRDRVTCHHEELECAITKAAAIAALMESNTNLV